MADALISYVLGKLASIVKEKELMIGIHQLETKKLRESLKKIKSVLEDAEEKESTDESVKDFVEDIKDIAYDIEDLFDEWLKESYVDDDSGHGINQKIQKKKKVCSSNLIYSSSVLGSWKTILLIHKRVQKIKALRKRLDFYKIKSYELNLIETELPSSPLGKDFPIITTDYDYEVQSDDDDVVVYGRDSDKNFIVKKLVETLESEIGTGLPVFTIFGIGGIGKTTLAKQVFNSEDVKSHFEMRVWVSVSQNFDQEMIIRQIIEAATAATASVHKDNDDGFVGSNDDLLHLLSNRVKGKRFLLVLDDVWDEDIQNWQGLKHSLKTGAQGSKVMVTTRNKMAAYLMSTTHLYHLGKLSDEDSWFLFRRIALMGKKDDKDELKESEDIGRKLVKLCYGHPLAVKVLAGLMRFKRTRKEWLYVMECDKWEQLEMEPILPPLQFAYNSLPSHLKRCFTYTSIFPEDHKINKDMLIKLWMAQGFLDSSKVIDLEMIGEEYFQNLVMRSFLQGLNKDKDGKVTDYKVHDLLRELALSISQSSIVGIYKTELISSKLRHLSISNTDSVCVLPSLSNLSKLRTLKLYKCKLIPPHLFNHLKFLRVLDLSFSSFEKLPIEIGRLIHLRYLDLSRTKLKCLPDSICNVYNLQTLRLNGCEELCQLPKGMKKLSNLRHLEIRNTPMLRHLPRGIGRLSSLRTLSKFIVTAAKGECKIGELKDLHKLQGSIYIEGLCRVENLSESEEAGLKNKEYLQDLILDFWQYEPDYVGEVEVRKMESVLKGLKPHPNLEKLAIHHCHVSKFPSWMGSESTLSSLRTLTINNCQELEQLPALGKLPSLQELCIQNLDGVKHIGNEFYGIGSHGGVKIAFQVLEELLLVDMANLEQWDLFVQDEKIMPRLRDLCLQNCPKLMSVPHIFSDTLMNLCVSCCPNLPSSTFGKLNLQEDTGVLQRSPFDKSPPKQSQVLHNVSFEALLPA